MAGGRMLLVAALVPQELLKTGQELLLVVGEVRRDNLGAAQDSFGVDIHPGGIQPPLGDSLVAPLEQDSFLVVGDHNFLHTDRLEVQVRIDPVADMVQVRGRGHYLPAEER